MRNKTVFFIVSAICILTGFVGAALLMLALTGEFQPEFSYFATNSMYAKVVYGALIVGACAAIAHYVFNRKEVACDRPFRYSIPSLLVSVASAIGIAFNTIHEVIEVPVDLTSRFYIFTYICRVLGILAFFALIVIGFAKDRSRTVVCAFSFFPSLFFAFKALCDYFNESIAVNSPVKIMYEITFLAIMLSYTFESGMLLGRGQLYSKYLFSLGLASTFAICTGLGGLFASISGLDIVYTDLSLCIMISIIGISCAVKLFLAANISPKPISDDYSAFFENLEKQNALEKNDESENNSET